MCTKHRLALSMLGGIFMGNTNKECKYNHPIWNIT